MAEQEEPFRYIVRIAGKDLNGSLPISMALTGIKGVGHRMAKNISIAFEKQSGISHDSLIGKIPEEQEKRLEEIVLLPSKFGVPAWALNRKKDYESGNDLHLVSNDLALALRQDLSRLNEIKSYRGLRHSWGLPVRGQRTKSTHRRKGGVVGVMKKEAKQAIKSQAAEKEKAGKKEEKK